MTRITHVLRDGTIKEDITGHVVKYKEKRELYDRLRRGIDHAYYKHAKPAAAVRGSRE